MLCLCYFLIYSVGHIDLVDSMISVIEYVSKYQHIPPHNTNALLWVVKAEEKDYYCCYLPWLPLLAAHGFGK